MTDMSGAYYPTAADTGEGGGGNQFYPAEKPDHGQSLGVYTPDSSTNSVHSMHGFTTGHDSGEFHAGGPPGDTSGEYPHPNPGDNPGEYHGSGAADTSADYTHSAAEAADAAVHNAASVMESPNSIGSVEIPQVYDANGMAHHRLPSAAAQGNSPQHVQQQQQMTAAMHGNMNKHSPHHQQTPITSQSPHPLPNQSPHPQPSPHNQQSSPHPQIIPQQNTPYTGLPHMSPTPQPTPYAPSRSSQQQQQQQSTSKSPRQQNRAAAAQHLSSQQQAAHHAFAAQYIAASQYGEAAMVANIARKHPSNPMYRYDPAFGMFSGTTFPTTTGVGHTPPALAAPHYSGRAGHHMDTHAQQVVSAQVQFYNIFLFTLALLILFF